MTHKTKLSYPWRWQIAFLVAAGGGIIAYALVVPLDAGFYFSVPGLKLEMSFFILFILAMALIAITPVVAFRRRRKSLHEMARICGRCEKELPPGSAIARYGSEFLCEECIKHMEGIRGEELTKFIKPEGM